MTEVYMILIFFSKVLFIYLKKKKIWQEVLCKYMFYTIGRNDQEMLLLPIRSLLRRSMDRFLRAMATARTTLSESERKSSTRIGSPFSLRTVARI